MKNAKRGFTLVELIIVIAVIGILAAILIPVFSNVIDKANAKSALSDGRNTVEQYIIDAMDKGNLPKNIIVFVKKAHNMYIYGYSMQDSGIIKKANDGKAYEKYSNPTQLMTEFSFNLKHPGQVPDLTGNTEYVEAQHGAFWLVPYGADNKPSVDKDDTGTVTIKGFHGTKDVDMSAYPEFSDQMTEKMSKDEIWVYHGYLLNGTYSLDYGEGGSDPDTPTDSTIKYTMQLKFYDTWNETTIDAGTVETAETTVAYSEVSSRAPQYWHSSTDTATVASDNTVTFSGTQAVEIDSILHQVVSSYAGFNKIGNNMSGNYALIDDVCFGDSVKHEPLGWTDDADVWFSGRFDGQGHTIYANNELDCITEGTNVGLFALNQGTIKNLILEFDEIEGSSAVGSLCGQNNGTIINCHARGRSVGGTNASASKAGGLVGVNGSSGNISRSSVELTETSGNKIGVYGKNYVGGFTGQNNGKISECYAKASVNAGKFQALQEDKFDAYDIGGFVGGNIGTITNCYSKANNMIVGTQRIGGFIGWTGSRSVITNCYVDVSELFYGEKEVSATIGVKNGTVSGCYAISSNTGSVNGFTRTSNVGSSCGWDTSIWNTSLAKPTLNNITIVAQS